MSDLFGWDLIYKLTEKDIKKKEDIIALIVHFVLIRNNYKCIGIGDSKSLTGNEEAGEILPNGWNATYNYSIRYMSGTTLYLLRGFLVEGNIVFNFMQADDLTVSNVAFNASSTVHCLHGTLPALLDNHHEQVLAKIKTDLLDPHTDRSTNKEATTQTPKVTTNVSSSQSNPIMPSHIPPIHPGGGRMPVGPPNAGVDPFWNDPERDPLRIGRSDLDPFGRGGGGGMIFNPFDPRPGVQNPGAGIPGGLPRGAVPPGARFDPFGPGVPPGPPRPRPPPDSSEFYPPGFDDMFM